MNKCTACENMQEASGVCEKCGVETVEVEAQASPEAAAPAEEPESGSEGAAM